ncbi:MAG TPA: DUF6569 family protein [Terriglobales bacterium]|nr:DUF6569 family protein [Terriglobales bacterium]
MNWKIWLMVAGLVGLVAVVIPCLKAHAGETVKFSGYKALTPIRHGSLTVFPVVAAGSHDTHEFLTLDEGLRSGEVVVSEYGSVQPLIRRRVVPMYERRDQAEVNRLVLLNNSQRPLILLAGEIVTGGKQDRVIGKDRLVPAESDPVDLSVFCVEPGRWVGSTSKFGGLASSMAQPNIRARAMSSKNQEMVWSEVRKAQAEMSNNLSAPAAAEVRDTSSYATVMQNGEVREKVDAVAAPMERDYRSLIQQLRERNAVGVVVAVNGKIIWADIFASTDLLQKYWAKLARSYAAEAVIARSSGGEVEIKSAQQFLDDMEGRHQTVESEPGLYRHTEVSGDGFKAFELMSLLPKTGFDLHVAKMAD